jgi:cytochrome c553
MKITMKSENIYKQKGGEKRMKYSKTILAFGAGVFVLATVAFLSDTWATENVRNSKHNLSLNPNIAAQGTTEVCIFCHTPHGGDTVAEGAAPLWNRNLSYQSGQTYVMYLSPNFDSVGTTGKPQGVSLACLSCHDGAITFDALLNFPGSGSADGITFTDHDNVSGGKMVNTGGKLFPMLGTDLSNDHPISMEIPCGKDPQFDNTVSGSTEKQICNNLVQSELTAGRISPLYRGPANTVLPTDKRDQIRAYPTVAGKAYIECASCHNPHEESNAVTNANGTVTILAGFTGTPRDTRFLRYPSFVGASTGILPADLDQNRNMGSLLCLSCHQK